MKKWLFMLAALVVFAAPAQAALYEGYWGSPSSPFYTGELEIVDYSAMDAVSVPTGQWSLDDFTYTPETDYLLPTGGSYTPMFESLYGGIIGGYDIVDTYNMGSLYLAGMDADSTWTWSDTSMTFYNLSATVYLDSDYVPGETPTPAGILGINFVYETVDSFFDVWFFGELKDIFEYDDGEEIHHFLASVDPTGLEITAVPVPAAVWLLGSGLLGLVGLRRKFSS